MNDITEGQALELLKALQTVSDVEVAHYDADQVLCRLLHSMGYEEVVVEYRKIEKWYS